MMNKYFKKVSLILVPILSMALWNCSNEESKSVNPPQPSGTIKITVQTSGTGSDADGYTIEIGQNSYSIGSNAVIYVPNISPGTYSINLTELDTGCDVISSNPRTGVVITDGDTTDVVFEITCTALGAYGDIEIHIITDGTDPDNKYYIVIDGTDSTEIIPGATLPDTTIITITDTAGTHQVELADISVNCNSSETNPQTVLLQENMTTAIAFHINCAGDQIPDDIVFVRYDNLGVSQVWVCDAQGNNQTQLTFGGNNKDLPRWSPDGTRILYNGEVVDQFGSVISGEIVLMNADGSLPDTVTFPANFEPGPADWSPTGTSLIVKGTLNSYPTEPNYFVYNFATLSSPLLSYSNQPGWLDYKFSMPFWSPVDNTILFSAENSNLSTYHTTSIFTVSSAGGDAVLIAKDTPWGFMYPQWSDDGNKLVFNGPNSHIWSCNSDGSNLHPVYEQGAYNGQPTWLPDGRIAFKPDAGTGLIIINDDGTGLINIGAGIDSYFNQPDWNPSPK